MSAKRLDLAYIAAGGSLGLPTPVQGATVEELKKQCGEAVGAGLAESREWQALAEEPQIAAACAEWVDRHGAPLPGPDLATALSVVTELNFPLKMGHLPLDDGARRRLIVAWYAMRGRTCLPRRVVYTAEQRAVIARGELGQQTREPWCLVSAGPGTGKTTAAVAMIRRALEAGLTVMYVTYTNAALRVFRRAASADPDLAPALVWDAMSVRKLHAKQGGKARVLVTSVDKVAQALVQRKAGGAPTGANPDKVVELALGALNHTGRPDLEDAARGYAAAVFLGVGGVPLIDHIAADEAQAFTEQRARLLQCLARVLTYEHGPRREARTCHLTFLGDPRQRITENGGEWLSRAWAGGAGGREWRKLELSVTHRFRRPQILEFVNAVSRTRPSLHVELRGRGRLKDGEGPAVTAAGEGDLAAVAARAAALWKEGRTVGFLGSSLGRNNAASKMAGGLALELGALGVPVQGLGGRGNFEGSGAAFLTYNSAAGAEFDYVWVLGGSGYPYNPNIKPEVARGLVFVACSRAKLGVCFVLSGPQLPLSVPRELVVGEVTNYELPAAYEPRLPANWTVETAVGDRGGGFYEINGAGAAACFRKVRARLPRCSAWAARVALVGERGGARRGEKLREAAARSREGGGGRPVEPRLAAIQGHTTRGIAIGTAPVAEAPAGVLEMGEGRDEALSAYYRDERAHKVRPPALDDYGAAQLKAEVAAALYEAAAAEAAEGAEDFDVLPEDVSFVGLRPCSADVGGWGGFWCCPDLCDKATGAAVVVGPDPAEATYAAAVLGPSWRVFHLDPEAGALGLFNARMRPLAYYLTSQLPTLAVYRETAILRDNRLCVPEGARPGTNVYAVDTEFTQPKGGAGGGGNPRGIYEIAAINLGDPHRSLCALIADPGAKLENVGLSAADYRAAAIPLGTYAARFGRVTAENPATELLYYSSPVDKEWAEGTKGLESRDVAAEAATWCGQRGVFLTAQSRASLDDLVGCTVGTCPYLGDRHRAAPDAAALGIAVRAMRGLPREAGETGGESPGGEGAAEGGSGEAGGGE